jgi:CubicO group peptidase (beta-lactamase class C family)
MDAALRRVAQRAVLDGLLDLAGSGAATARCGPSTGEQIDRLRLRARGHPGDRCPDRGHRAAAVRDIARHPPTGRDDRAARPRPAPIAIAALAVGPRRIYQPQPGDQPTRHRSPPMRLAAVVFALVLAGATMPARAQVNPSIFPVAAPEDVGMSSAGLREAMDSIAHWVEQKRIMGGILIVVRHGRLVFHEAAGWNDAESGVRLDRDDILLMRSMTKPLTGTGVLLLMEEGRLALEDRASAYLSAWNTDALRDITIRQLLTHTSGVSGELPSGHATLRDAVAAKARAGTTFPPGTRYRYADANSAALGAIIEVVSGMPAERFLTQRILEPLGMRDSYLWDVPADDPRRARTAAGYRGSAETREWRRYRGGSDVPITRFFGASGGLYATGLDYLRFLWMMLHDGEFQGTRLLHPETVRLALEPHSRAVYTSSDLMSMTRLYGLHWYVWTDRFGVNPWPMSPGSFGHGGAEGTFAWVDPARGLVCLYLTQTNGTDTRPTVPRLVYGAIIE